MSYEACILSVREAAKEKLSKEEIDSLVDRAKEIRARVEAEGKLDDLNERVKKLTEDEANKVKIAAALQRKQAAINILVRDRLNSHIDGLVKAGFSYPDAIQAIFEGTQKNVANARKSVDALRQAYQSRYIGGMFAEIDEAVGRHIADLADDQQLNDDIVREMYELREGGQPGKTGNRDAQKVAAIFAKYSELSRLDANKKGAAIGRLDGWAGPQKHSDRAMLKAGKDEWIETVKPLLDLDRTFPEGTAKVDETLGQIWTTIVTGQSGVITALEKGERVGPANLAKTLGKSRFLHFKNADAWINYNAKFGDGTVFSAMLTHQNRMASTVAQMDTFGPNPRVMFDSLLDKLQRQVRDDPKIPTEKKAAIIAKLSPDNMANRAMFAEMSGVLASPNNMRAAKINRSVREVASMASLGGAGITAVFSDTMTAGLAGMFRGGGFLRTITRQIAGLLEGRPKAEQARISYLLGEGFDGFTGEIMRPDAAADGVPGVTSKISTIFYRFNGLTWLTDVGRSVAARMISADMGAYAKADWAKLPASYQSVLTMHGLTPAKWDALRTINGKLDNGNVYLTPDMARQIPDAAIEPLIKDRVDKLALTDPEKREKAVARFRDDMRLEIELDMGRFFADETSFAVVETDATTRRYSTAGLQPGTLGGELARYIMQFKSFPIAFTTRILGRAWNLDPTAAGRAKNLGGLIVGLGAAGYMSMAAKDTVKGRWPPRDPADPKVMLAALLQGGALGVYGDYLFGEANRFGNSPLESLSGPVATRAANVIGLYQKAKTGDASAGDALNQIINATPFANLFYVKPALDATILNAAREWASPGYRRRQEQRLMKDYGQRLFY